MPERAKLVRAILRALPVPVVLSARDNGLVLYANEPAARAFGIPLSRLIGFQTPDVYVRPEDRTSILHLIEAKGRLREHEVLLKGPNGSPFWALASIEPLDYEDQTCLCTIFVDVSDRKREQNTLVAARSHAETVARARSEELAETERRLGNVLRNILGAAYRCSNDERWTMQFISEGCTQLTGYEPDELVGNRVAAYGDLIHPDDRHAVWDAVQVAARARQPFQIDYRIRTKDGVEKWVWEQGAAVYEGDELVAHEGVIHDVSERKKAEEERQNMELQMRAAQRMEAVGRLAGGVAHDFNNLLTVIDGYARFLRDDFREGDPAREDADAILSAAERAARLTGQLLAFSRRQIQELRVVNLNETVAELDKMLRRLIGEDIELVTRLSPDLGRVKVDITQIEQILMNLVVNARDAMPTGGKLTIETGNVELEESYGAAKNVELPPGHYVMLSVTDTGTGMDKETQSQIFEPFFTTKEKGKGTGLGLSTVFGIVKQSGGYVWVYSEPNQGTTFKVYLPRVEEERTPEAPPRRAAPELHGTETILIVEDEVPVRKVAARILKRYGYQVLEASHGGEALLLCERHDGPIHLMLTDVIMPQMSGRELAERLSTVRPEMRVIFSSGYTDDAVARHGVLEEGTPFIPKPFSTEALVQKVRETLDEDRERSRAPGDSNTRSTDS